MDDQQAWEEIKAAYHENNAGHLRVLCERYLAEHGEMAGVLVYYGSSLTDLFLYEEAEAAFDRAESLAPERLMHVALGFRGRMQKQRGEFLAAEQTYLRAAALQPQDAHLSDLCRFGGAERGQYQTRRRIECTGDAMRRG